jgi:glycosyltransferase involved in cell wall biosynthesis
VIGINYFGEPYDHEEWSIKVMPAYQFTKRHIEEYDDFFGRQRIIDELSTGQYDILFTLQDPFLIATTGKVIAQVRDQLKEAGRKSFKWIYYYPVDGNQRTEWIQNAVELADYPVAYTEYGKSETIKYALNKDLRVDVIPHGTDTSIFYKMARPESRKFKREIFGGLVKDKFLITNVNRNQRRKAIWRTLQVFADFKKRCNDAILYLHMQAVDDGGDFVVMAKHLGLTAGEDVLYLPTLGDSGVPTEVLNTIYNVSDVIISTTLGEGWGLTTTEAMATKTPVIMPKNTSLVEICANNRGILVDCDETINLGNQDLQQFRPLVNVKKFSDALFDVYSNPGKYNEMVENAYNWVKELTWDKIGEKWITLFAEASQAQQKELPIQRVQLENGRSTNFGEKLK